MKHLYLIRLWLIGYILLTGCSPKETFYFSHSTGNTQKVQPKDNLLNSLVIDNKLTDLGCSNSNDTPLLSAKTAMPTHPEQLRFAKQTPVEVFYAYRPAKKVEMHPFPLIAKNTTRINKTIKKYLDDPVAKKKVQGAALIGFIFSMAALVSFFAPSWPLAALLGLIGSILGIVGFIKIKRNPDKYSGKGFAWLGVFLGLIFALFIIGFIVSYGSGV